MDSSQFTGCRSVVMPRTLTVAMVGGGNENLDDLDDLDDDDDKDDDNDPGVAGPRRRRPFCSRRKSSPS